MLENNDLIPDDDELLKQTFMTFSEAMGVIPEEELKAIIANLYAQVCKGLSQERCAEISDEFCNIFTNLKEQDPLKAYDEFHAEYKAIIHEPYALADYMLAARKDRAKSIGAMIVEKLGDSNNSDMPILDYGCGAGEPAIVIADKTGREIVAADVGNFLPQGVAEKIHFNQIEDGVLIPDVETASVGDAFLSYSLHCANGFEYKQQFKELARVIAPGGKLILLETGVADDNNKDSFTEQKEFLKAQLLGFVTSNFFRDEPIKMTVAGNYYDETKWQVDATAKKYIFPDEGKGMELVDSENPLFTVHSVEHLEKDKFGEACVNIILERTSNNYNSR